MYWLETPSSLGWFFVLLVKLAAGKTTIKHSGNFSKNFSLLRRVSSDEAERWIHRFVRDTKYSFARNFGTMSVVKTEITRLLVCTITVLET